MPPLAPPPQAPSHIGGCAHLGKQRLTPAGMSAVNHQYLAILPERACDHKAIAGFESLPAPCRLIRAHTPVPHTPPEASGSTQVSFDISLCFDSYH